MKKWVWIAAMGFFFSLGLSAKMSRDYDPVVVAGSHLPAVNKALPGELRLFAFQGGGFQPIVYQIDERYQEMLYWHKGRRRNVLVYALNVGEKVKADPDPTFDSDDELAFMAADSGDQAPAGAWPAGAEVCQEIKVRDPDGGGSGYAYLCRFKNSPPALDRSYISISGSNKLITAKSYQLGYSDHELFFDQLQLPSGGQWSPNLVDRFKINIEVQAAFGMIPYQLSNLDTRAELRGYRVGPVRVIKEVVSITEGWPHVFNRLLHQIYFYPYHMEWDMEVRAPVVWDDIHEFDYSLALDMSPAVEGSKLVTEKNPVPVTVDGVYDPEETALNYGPQQWIAMSTQWGSIYSHLAFPDQAKDLYPDLYYVDMAQKPDTPEKYFGMFGKWGYKVKNVQKTGRRPVLFRLDYFFSPESYQAGSEKNLVGIYTNPLKVEMDHSQSSAMVKSPPATEEKRSPSDQPIASQAMKESVKQGTWSIYPNLILDPSNTGYGGGLGYSNADMFKAGVGFDISTIITTRNYYDLSISFSKLQFIPWVDTLEVSAALQQFPSQTFYGIGNESELDDAALYWWTRNQATIKVEKRFLDHYGANLSLFYKDTTIKAGQQPLEGTQVGQPSFEKHYGFWDELEDSERWGGPLYGRDGGMTNGLTLSLFRDMRDDWQVPHRGDYEAISVTRVGPEMASDYDYTKLSIDLRKYFEPSWLQNLPMDNWFSSDRTLWGKFFGPEKHRSVDFWVGATHTFSREFDYYHQTVQDVPFYELSAVGGGSNNRGFYGNRFVDNDAFSVSAEYRWQYWRWFDAAVFVDSGMVMPDMFDGENWNGVWHTSYGAGFRAHVPPGVTIVFDFSFSPDVPGGMLTQGWVF